MDHHANIEKARRDFEMKFPGQKVFAIILTARPKSPGQIVVLGEHGFQEVFKTQKADALKAEIRARWETYRDDPLILVEAAGGTMRTQWLNVELRAMGAKVVA